MTGRSRRPARDLLRDVRTALDARGDVPSDTLADLERTIAYGLLAIRDRVRDELVGNPDMNDPSLNGALDVVMRWLDPR